MEMRCCRKILRISCKDHVTNEKVRVKIQQAIGPHDDKIQQAIGPHDDLLTVVVWNSDRMCLAPAGGPRAYLDTEGRHFE